MLLVKYILAFSWIWSIANGSSIGNGNRSSSIGNRSSKCCIDNNNAAESDANADITNTEANLSIVLFTISILWSCFYTDVTVSIIKMAKQQFCLYPPNTLKRM